MRHQAEIRPVASFQEESHPSNKPKHVVPVVWIRRPDSDRENSHQDSEDMDKGLLAPHAHPWVDKIADHASQGTEYDVEQTEHSSPIPAPCLLERREVLDVVGAEDAVDGEFGAERAEVGAASDESLEREDNREGFAERGLDDNFAAGGVKHLLFSYLSFVCESFWLFRLDGFEAEFLFCAVVAGAVCALVARSVSSPGTSTTAPEMPWEARFC